MKDFSSLGKNLKEIRSQMGLTLNAASELTGVSKTMLSQIERSESVPTLSVIWKIANGLKIRLETLTEDKDNFNTVCSMKDITPLRSERDDVFIYNVLPFAPENGFEVFCGDFLEGSNYLSSGHANGKFEYCFVVCGEIDILVDENSYHLTEGDFITFDARNEHRYLNNGTRNAIVFFIVNYN